MLQHPINVLVVAAEEPTTRAVEEIIKQMDGRGFYLQRVVGIDDGLQALENGGCDVCLLDITPPSADDDTTPARLPGSNPTVAANRFMQKAEQTNPPIPVLLLADESLMGCRDETAPELPEVMPLLLLDRSRLTPYLLERAMCFSLERARLQQEINLLRMIDSLTGLLTRQEMDRKLESELERCRRYRYPLSLLALEVDDYLNLIAKHGEVLGDQILRWISMILQENIRTVDRAARYTNSEFVMVLPETTDQAAAHVARRLQQRIASRPFVLFPNQGPVIELGMTVSVGVVEASRESDTPDSLVLMAERSLKEAQRQRRNRIIVYGEIWKT
jgi:diguanylate cyclase (GGDEF)-like protein